MGEDAEPADNTGRSKRGALWPWLGLATAVYCVGRLLPLPGVDQEALAAVGAQSGFLAMFNEAVPGVSIIGANAATLVLVQVILILIGRIEHPRFRLAGVAVFLGLTTVQGVALAITLEGLNRGGWADVVVWPGWGFRLSAALASTTGGAVLWWAFQRIDATGRAYGALYLALLLGVGSALQGASSAGSDIALGMAPFEAFVPLAMPVAAVAIAAVLLWRPVRWPICLFGSVRVRSGWDVVGIGALGSVPFVGLPPPIVSMLVGTSSPSAASFVGVLAALGVAFAVVAIRLRQPTKPGAVREWGLAVASVLLLFVSIGTLGIGLTMSGALEAALAPGPLEGDARFHLTLEAEGRFAPGDADAMIQRLSSLGAEARIERASATQIEIAVEGASDLRGVLDALTPRRLELRFAHELEETHLQDRAELTPLFSADYDSRRVRAWQGSCALIEALVSGPSPVACEYVIERAQQVDAECTLHCLEPNVVLTGRDVAEATVGSDPMLNMPMVLIVLTDEAAGAFAEATAAHIRRTLAIVIDGEVISAPMVQTAIPGGRLQVTLGSIVDYEEMVIRASNLANALQPGAQISTPFVVVEETLR